ncbi:MAG: OmpA family protein [Myxococcota bacterium]
MIRAPGIVLITACSAFAQSTPVVLSLERLTLEPGSAHSLSVGSGDGLREGLVSVSLLGHYEHAPLVFRSEGARVGDIVRFRATAHLVAAWGVTDWLELGLQLPVFAQAGDDLSGAGLAAPAGFGLGAPLVRARVTGLREDLGRPFDLGATLAVALPVGTREALARDPGTGLSVSPRLGAGKRLGPLRVGVELGAEFREQPTFVAYSTRAPQQLTTLLSGAMTVSSLGALRGGVDVRATTTATDAPIAAVEVLGQVRWTLPRGLEVTAAAGPGFGRLAGTPAFRALLGLAWAPLGGAPCVEGLAYRGRDCPLLDRDGDGVANGLDACPELAGRESNAGCPLEEPPPQPAEFFFVERVDRDLDGVRDAEDRCPALAGSRALAGCPFDVSLASAEIDLADYLHQQIHFVFDSARLELDGDALEEAAQLLEAVPEGVVTIEGHTDAIGTRAYNLGLSRRRADAVRAALIAHGIAPERLQVSGRAFDEPVASNRRSEGRARNRRVRFLLSPREGLAHAP